MIFAIQFALQNTYVTLYNKAYIVHRAKFHQTRAYKCLR